MTRLWGPKVKWLWMPAAGLWLFFWSLKVGSVELSWGQLFPWLWKAGTGGAAGLVDPAASILIDIRLPRVLMAAMVGASLAAVGGALQALFRNPLADPYLLGVSSGAALGAVIGLILGWASPAFFSCGGAGLTLAAVILLSRIQAVTSVSLMVLAGAAVHSLSSALLTLILSQVSRRYETSNILFWLLGSLDTLPYATLVPLLLLSGGGLGALMLWAPALNLLAQGEETAHTLGLGVERTKVLLILLCAFLVGLAVTFNGMIPFVGLVVPHISRLLFGPDHRISLPMAAVLGALLVMTADALGRTLLAPREIPTGVITALGGAPYFLYILRRERRRLL